MMSSINALLNHEGAAPARRESVSTPAYTTQTTTYEAADALTALATLGSGQQYALVPSRELPSPTAFSSNAPRRSSSFGSHHDHRAPVEPSPPTEQPAVHSPTLDHYHHGSHSPEEQKRRQSLLTSPAPVLAPMQSLPSSRQDQAGNSPSSASATPIGHDVSQVVTDAGETAKDSTQQREPAFVRDEPHTSQIREPEPEPVVKDEHQNPATGHGIDADTLKAIEAAKASDLGLRAKRTASVAESVTSPSESKPTAAAAAAAVPSKKRPAPSSSSAAKKKGTAKTTKPSNKKRKIEDDDTKARSVTPTSRPTTGKSGKKGSQAGTPALQSSPAPEDTAYGHDDDDGESSEDHNLYCICKKPDNHKWMIGCDGGCDDWFHGDCVNMKQADENLVDRFICPLCEEAGRGHTTWKPMCRRDGCRKPARVAKDHQSKYCSDECGVLFMQEQLQRTAGAKGANGTKDKPKKKKKVVRPEDEGHDDEEEPTPLGGVLRAKDLKALVDASPNIQAFRNLGSGVLSPPHTASPTRPNFPSNPDDVALTPAETERLNALHNEKSQLNDRLEVLKDREKFVSMAKEQATRVADREKMKLKEFCGYDSRLSWSDAEFLLWRNSKHGRAAFNFSTLSPTAEQVAGMEDGSPNGVLGDVEVKESVCLKKRCAKHPQWQKLNLQDARFEELEVVEAIKECEKEERSVRERARRRNAKDTMAKELTAGDGTQEVRNREGWVEAVAT
ncbi:COMPASS (complex proteins associated with Set1p) component [Didymella sp. IMI 355093]|nr:COMPASS (complex proteins associated with Set1p) component [Didymella sp. IMI 355093]